VFVDLNSALHRQQRRLAVVAVMLGLAAAIVTAHSVSAGDHMGDGVAMCLAVAETAVIAVGAALVVGAGARRRRWFVAERAHPEFAGVPTIQSVPARAGPPLLQVFQL
jgi:hypothetical protein